ncbi:hypothetical protein KY290_005751 [Solanum tuberosum]|uniref:Uncharacterized protein n=1 Tax=Solanum tuberosum TaxID=4113 RepID=A0ABQ7WGX8_SOLTU|nr:hypothetical protein KY284_005802 [Solanum tuberosum]KAH0779324.1 hypothetical protein KY290_005751 [Solanum tuberosum]
MLPERGCSELSFTEVCGCLLVVVASLENTCKNQTANRKGERGNELAVFFFFAPMAICVGFQLLFQRALEVVSDGWWVRFWSLVCGAMVICSGVLG